MKFQDEYRQPKSVQEAAKAIANITTRPWKIMEVCGGQTHSIIKYGIDKLLPPQIELLHGPGCPVCVTPIDYIDKAIEISLRPNVVLCSYGDMLRVPGSKHDLFWARTQGADVRIVYSPLDALEIAKELPNKHIVFFAVGFETTAPANAMAAYQARAEEIANFSLLVTHVLVPPAIEAILSSPDNQVQGFLAAGHVCTIMGFHEYLPLSQKYHVPIVVTGFEPLDILQGCYLLIRQLEEGRAEVENQYERCVRSEGNLVAQNILNLVFEISDRKWRGIGNIPQSGLTLRKEFLRYNSENIFGPVGVGFDESDRCKIGQILTGQLKPDQCPSFGKKCTPENPLGATMVSSEGACAAYFQYRGNPKQTLSRENLL